MRSLLVAFIFSSCLYATTYNCSPFLLPPGNVVRGVNGINNAGTVTGYYNDPNGVGHGFVDNLTTGNFASVDYPGGTQTQLFAINNNGTSAGVTSTPSVPNGQTFFTLDSSGNFHSIPIAPGYLIRSVYGINDLGDISGVVVTPASVFRYGVIHPNGTVTDYGSTQQGAGEPGSLNNALQMIENNGAAPVIVDSSGNVTRILYPNYPNNNVSTYFGTGLNNPGTFIGVINGGAASGFLRDASGNYSEVFCPGISVRSVPSTWGAINDNGVLASVSTIATPVPGQAQTTLSATTVTFPPTNVGQPSSPQSLTITDSGNARLDIGTIYIIPATGSSQVFTVSGCVDASTGTASLDPGSSCTLTLHATPRNSGDQSATLYIEDSSPGSPHTVSLSINGASPPPPSCAVTGMNPGPPAQVTFTMQDASIGLATISVPRVTNAAVNIPSFTRGTLNPVNVSGTQRDTSVPSVVQFLVTNTGGSSTTCSSNFGGGWMGLGGGVTGRISVIRNSDGTLQAFARGTDNALWTLAQTSPNGAWGVWQSIGGVLASAPAVAKTGSGLLEVFVLGSDHSLWEASQSAPKGAFTNWRGLGQNLTSDPAVAVNPNGAVQVFATGNDHALWTIAETAPGGSWSGWTSLGGAIVKNPAAVTNTDGTVEAFVIGTDQGVWHIWQTSPGGAWSSWNELGGSISGSPVTVLNSSSGLAEVFGLGTDGAVWNISHPSGSGWSGWTSLGGFLTSDPAAALDTNGITEVFARGGDNSLWRTTDIAAGPPTGWNNWLPLGGTLLNGPAAAVNQDGRVAVFVEGSDTAMWTIEQASAGSWAQ